MLLHLTTKSLDLLPELVQLQYAASVLHWVEFHVHQQEYHSAAKQRIREKQTYISLSRNSNKIYHQKISKLYSSVLSVCTGSLGMLQLHLDGFLSSQGLTVYEEDDFNRFLQFCSICFQVFPFSTPSKPSFPSPPPPPHTDLVSVDVCLSWLVWANLLARGGNNLSGVGYRNVENPRISHASTTLFWLGRKL